MLKKNAVTEDVKGERRETEVRHNCQINASPHFKAGP